MEPKQHLGAGHDNFVSFQMGGPETNPAVCGTAAPVHSLARAAQNPWNLFDVLIVSFSVASLAISVPAVNALRLFRTIRHVHKIISTFSSPCPSVSLSSSHLLSPIFSPSSSFAISLSPSLPPSFPPSLPPSHAGRVKTRGSRKSQGVVQKSRAISSFLPRRLGLPATILNFCVCNGPKQEFKLHTDYSGFWEQIKALQPVCTVLSGQAVSAGLHATPACQVFYAHDDRLVACAHNHP